MSVNFIPNGINFKNFCERNGVELKIRNNDREWEHIQSCSDCKHGYVLFWIHSILINEICVDKFTESWLRKTEAKRQQLRRTLHKSLMRYFKQHIWKRAPSAYQTFLKNAHTMYPEIKSIEFGRQTMYISELWKNLSDIKREEYVKKADISKQQFLHNKKNLHAVIKFVAKEFRRFKKPKSMIYKKPLNSYMTYLSHRWKDECSKSPNNLTYHQVMKLASIDWNKMSPEDKLLYKNGSKYNSNDS